MAKQTEDAMNMKRRDVLAMLLAPAPFSARAQGIERTRRLGVLHSGSSANPSVKDDTNGLIAGLRDKGWVQGRNLQIDFRYSDGDPGRARSGATELIGLAPDLIFATGTVALSALKGVNARVPIVFANITDPVAGGFVVSLAHPGRQHDRVHAV